jgi:glycosyltransferase involved in cell wall biosynthesis
LLKAAQSVSWSTGRALRRKVRWEVEPFVLHSLTRKVEMEARRLGVDTVVAMGWHPLEPAGDVRFAFWGDATIQQRVGVAPYWTGLSTRTRRQVEATEERSLRQVLPIFASDWAARAAEDAYGIRAQRIQFGANIADPGDLGKAAPGEVLRILTVGVEWHRKGIDKAVETIDRLSTNQAVHLDVAGVLPPDQSWDRPNITWHGRVGKDQLAQLYSQADVFLLPTRDEPFGIVFGEAAAYGLPVVASRVGNVPERVAHMRTGVLVDPAAPADEWASAVSWAMECHESMSEAARAAYRAEWGWDRAVERLLTALSRPVATDPGV